MQAPRTDVCNLGATEGFYMISNSKSGRPKNSSCASLFCCCHALVLKYRPAQQGWHQDGRKYVGRRPRALK